MAVVWVVGPEFSNLCKPKQKEQGGVKKRQTLDWTEGHTQQRGWSEEAQQKCIHNSKSTWTCWFLCTVLLAGSFPGRHRFPHTQPQWALEQELWHCSYCGTQPELTSPAERTQLQHFHLAWRAGLSKLISSNWKLYRCIFAFMCTKFFSPVYLWLEVLKLSKVPVFINTALYAKKPKQVVNIPSLYLWTPAFSGVRGKIPVYFNEARTPSYTFKVVFHGIQ